MIDYNHNIG